MSKLLSTNGHFCFHDLRLVLSMNTCLFFPVFMKSTFLFTYLKETIYQLICERTVFNLLDIKGHHSPVIHETFPFRYLLEMFRELKTTY